MKNWVSVLALAAVLLVGCGRGGEAQKPPDAQPRAGGADLKSDCAEQADVFFKDERELQREENNSLVAGGQFAHSSVLDACLVYFEVVPPGSADKTHNIVNARTAKTLYQYVRYVDPANQSWWDASCKASEGCLGEAEFLSKRAELFPAAK